MTNTLREQVNRLANQIQIIHSALELDADPAAPNAHHEHALAATREAAVILHQIALLNSFSMTVPKGHVVVVPQDSIVVSSEDVLIPLPTDEVRTIGSVFVKRRPRDLNPRASAA